MNEQTLPEDIQKRADEVVSAIFDAAQDVWLPTGVDGIVGRAILAERQRCADLVKAMLVYADTTSGADEAIPAAIMDPNHWLSKNPELASAIRSGER